MLALGIILAHLVGDYLLQTHWMATQKTERWAPAILHGLTYTVPYVFVTQSPAALVVIAGTHIVIDRYRLARVVVWFKNQFAPRAFRNRCARAVPPTTSLRTPLQTSPAPGSRAACSD